MHAARPALPRLSLRLALPKTAAEKSTQLQRREREENDVHAAPQLSPPDPIHLGKAFRLAGVRIYVSMSRWFIACSLLFVWIACRYGAYDVEAGNDGFMTGCARNPHPLLLDHSPPEPLLSARSQFRLS